METRSIVLGFLIAGLIGGCMAEAEQEQATKKQQDKQEKKKNRLAKEKSPYLLQHAENPVDWYPWGKEAFEKAKKENKPIFLSIGYSTCHWCHVMEHESFENEEIAKYLNEHFVSIKVDREERPDVDEIYMTALTQVLGQHGGWPMSMFLTPDRKPFFGGTYFPPEDKFGRPGFPKILKSIHEYWDEKGEEALKSADAIAERLKEISSRTAQGELNPSLVVDALSHYEKVFDDTHGGFGRAPFFPQPSYGLFLLRHHGRTGSERSLAIVENQLEHMGEGGIYDHLGGGFARYSTDARWLVPHFEKMLYDNGQLLKLYAETYLATGSKNALYRRILRETSEYILRDMTDPKGGFYSAEDADSEGEEGKFYVWRHEEVAALLDKKSARVFGLAYDVSEEGNWEGDAHHGVKPLNVLNAKLTAKQVASLEKMDVAEVEKILAAARKTLFEAREKRIRPIRDDKILTAWNGLMISGFSAAGRALQEPRYIAAAEKAAEFIRATLYKDGTLKRRYRDGEAAIDATLNDYAFFVSGLLDLYEATFEAKWLLLASELNDRCVELFYDEDDGGFFFSLAGRADLIVRSKDFNDGAVPAGNSVATLNLVRLSEIRSNDALRTKAERSLGAQAELMKRYPSACPYLMIALDHLMGPAREIVIAGDPKAPETREMIEFVQTRFLPRTVVVLADGSLDVKLIPMLEGKTIVDGKPAVYVCENYTCKAPTTSLLELRRLLK